MGKLSTILATLALAGSTVAVHAADDVLLRSADHNGAAELTRGDLAGAERVLAASLRVSPNDNDLLLNRAQLLLRSGQVEAARATYRQVLAQPDEAMQLTGDRWVGSHALARAGMRARPAMMVAATTR